MLGNSKRVNSTPATLAIPKASLPLPDGTRSQRPVSPSLENLLSAVPFTTQSVSAEPVLPPWLAVLKESVRENEEEEFTSMIQIATLRPDGRPQNQSFQFRGFDPTRVGVDRASAASVFNPNSPSIIVTEASILPASAPPTLSRASSSPTDSEDSYFAPLPVQSSSPPKMINSLTLGKLSSLLTFTCDTRLITRSTLTMSFHTGDTSNTILITDDGANAEACWCMPRTKEEYRLRGQLYFIGSPESMDSASVPPPWGPKDWGFWENARQQVWQYLSPEEQARFIGQSDVGGEMYGQDGGQAKRGYRNFGLLLLDVDSVEHTVMGEGLLPALKMRYHVVVPRRTYGRITGLHWQVEGTRFE